MKFGEKARLHQEAFKNHSITISDKARNSQDDKAIRNPYLLTLDYEHENLIPTIREEAIEFFNNRGIPWWKDEKRTGDIKNNKPTRNMASSQVACVNFLLPLAQSKELILSVLKAIDSQIIDVMPICRNGYNSFVEFEYIGYRTTLENEIVGEVTPGEFRTSIDAFIVGRASNGNLKAFIIEWKYVEEYGKGELTGSNKTREIRYLSMYEDKASPFKTGALFKFEGFLFHPFYQIMRLLLFSRKLMNEYEPALSDAKVIVVCPEQNEEFRKANTSSSLHGLFPFDATVEELIKDCLVNPDVFSIIDPKKIFSAVCESKLADRDWIKYQMLRYCL